MGEDYYIFSNGRIKRKENTICFEDSEENRRSIPIEQVERIHLFGEIDLNTKLLNYIAQYGVMLNFYNYYGFYSGTFYPKKKNVAGLLVVKQSQHYINHEKRMYLAKSFIDSAVYHILRNLRNYKDKVGDIIDQIEIEKENMYKANEIDELMGCEGRIRRSYYSAFDKILNNSFDFTKREKRPPTDPVNALISFGNSLMYTTALGEMYQTQLDPTVSYLHEPSTKRFSLILDLTEIFKPLIVDPLIFYMINNNMLKLEDFQIDDGICFLNETGKKKFIKEYENKMSTTIKHRSLNRKVSYRTFIKLECYKLIKYFIEDEVYKPLKAWW
ncbi:type I-B CRISPR-associated endonuclease Cas1 [Clostridium sp. 19966]|uniref:type I-B CRISPR-associated endonuclease Cas1b n=1 Tax=Clostridium sp. 19966 TaxID=2768166 RepID=UPI0028DE29F4|nr:type I-B CRISPR-associated endonuclease Cas1b [Clostridium sp. 19966]MDT8719679.1 type I-B CRISPR-associated endonuclease Cas1 [Clostridium sp. 19966]